jgi:parallel beta-helix repeat protein
MKNTVYNNVQQNSCRCIPTAYGEGIVATASDYAFIAENVVYKNYGEGIGLYGANNGTITANISYDNYGCDIYVDSSINAAVSGNLTYNSGDTGFYKSGSPAYGTCLATEPGAPRVQNVTGLQYYDNIDIKNFHGLRWWNEASVGALINATIANNTFVNEIDTSLQIEAYSGHSGNKVQNNIFYKSTSGTLVGGTTTGVSYDHNLYFGGSSGSFAGTGDVNADPQLTNPTTFDPNDYRISGTSPAKAAGTTISTITLDFFGNPRTAPYSIGAHENDN